MAVGMSSANRAVAAVAAKSKMWISLFPGRPLLLWWAQPGRRLHSENKSQSLVQMALQVSSPATEAPADCLVMDMTAGLGITGAEVAEEVLAAGVLMVLQTRGTLLGEMEAVGVLATSVGLLFFMAAVVAAAHGSFRVDEMEREEQVEEEV